MARQSNIGWPLSGKSYRLCRPASGRLPTGRDTRGGGRLGPRFEIERLAERRFPPPWTIEELEACFIVTDSAGQICFPNTRRASSCDAPRSLTCRPTGAVVGLTDCLSIEFCRRKSSREKP